MNAERRKQIEKAKALIEEGAGLLSSAKDDEQGYYDNMPESLQQGERGTQAETAIELMETAIDEIENIDWSTILT